MSKLKLLLPAAIVFGMFSVIGCKKTTTNNTVVQDSIYYSSWSKLSMSMAVDQSTGDTFYTQTINAPAITAKIVSHGAVLGYYGFAQSVGDTLMFDEAELSSIAAMTVATGSIEIDASQDLSYTGVNGYLFRYVVIPGNVLAGTALQGMTQQQLNKMTFTEIQKSSGAPTQSSGNTFNP